MRETAPVNEVDQPILNSPYDEPDEYWLIREGKPPERKQGRRPSIIFPPADQRDEWAAEDERLLPSSEYKGAFELSLVCRIRERVARWRADGYPGVSKVTLELLNYWRHEGRQHRLFFAQLEAAETVIFLAEAREDYRQGIVVPLEEIPPSLGDAVKPLQRIACKMATGSGKSTVMALVIAWSVLNKAANRSDPRFSDAVLIVCPNVTIRDRLRELDPKQYDASLYRTRDIVPQHLMPVLSKASVLITNWHAFLPQSMNSGGTSARVLRTGVPQNTIQTIFVGDKNTTARGRRYMTPETLTAALASGAFSVVAGSEVEDEQGNIISLKASYVEYVESDTALVRRVLQKAIGGKTNLLVINDEAHHAYRIHPARKRADDLSDDSMDAADGATDEEFKAQAAVWVSGLDRINKARAINFVLDLRATPFYLARGGLEAGRPFHWLASDFGLVEAIESGLVKIPQMAVRDTTGKAIPSYFNIWDFVMAKLTAAERGGKRGRIKPGAVLKWAHTPIAMLGGLWTEEYRRWTSENASSVPPVLIVVCKDTEISKVIYDWIAEDVRPPQIPSAKLPLFINKKEQINTIRVDSKVAGETSGSGSKADEHRWMRFVLSTVGRPEWPKDRLGQPLYPDGFVDLAAKLERPLHPPGARIRCIVSVGMLTEGWDCNTVTHIVGLRPFGSQLLCEQVVGRALRRSSYTVNSDGKFDEEVAKVFGVPFDVIPCKANKPSSAKSDQRIHVAAVPQRKKLEIFYPRVDRYRQSIRNKIRVDWERVAKLEIKPEKIPPHVEMKGVAYTNEGRMSLSGPGKTADADLRTFREAHSLQELSFEMAATITDVLTRATNANLNPATQSLALGQHPIPAQALFPQVYQVVARYVQDYVKVRAPADIKDLFLAPYYGWLVEVLMSAIRPDVSEGEHPEVAVYDRERPLGSTSEVDYFTSKPVYPVTKSHVNVVVADTKQWEQSAAYQIDKHPSVVSFVKNAGLGFGIPYAHNDRSPDYQPDFIIRMKTKMRELHVIFEVKGFDELEEFKKAAAQRWVDAVNAEGSYGVWAYRIAKDVSAVTDILDAIV